MTPIVRGHHVRLLYRTVLFVLYASGYLRSMTGVGDPEAGVPGVAGSGGPGEWVSGVSGISVPEGSALGIKGCRAGIFIEMTVGMR